MPRDTIDLRYEVERLSILDEDGNLDADLAPDLEDERLLEMHRTILLARRFDARMLELQRQGRIGTFAPVKGQEAAQVGAVAAITDDDWMVPSLKENPPLPAAAVKYAADSRAEARRPGARRCASGRTSPRSRRDSQLANSACRVISIAPRALETGHPFLASAASF